MILFKVVMEQNHRNLKNLKIRSKLINLHLNNLLNTIILIPNTLKNNKEVAKNKNKPVLSVTITLPSLLLPILPEKTTNQTIPTPATPIHLPDIIIPIIITTPTNNHTITNIKILDIVKNPTVKNPVSQRLKVTKINIQEILI